MKTINKIFIQAAFMSTVLFTAVSCENGYQTEQTKGIADEFNDAKFNDSKIENDAQFLVNAAEINLEEIQLGQLAQTNGTTAEVKELGKMMEAEHTKLLKELTEIAKQKLITLPTATSENAQKTYKDLSVNSSTDFDKKYCDLMVKEHKNAIDLFEKASTESTDVDIIEWTNATLPILRTHLDYALTFQQQFE